MQTLIENIKNRNYSYVASVLINQKTRKNLGTYTIHKIVSSNSDYCVGYTNLISGGIKVIHRYPTSEFEMLDNGYIEKVDCGKYGIRYKKVLYIKSLDELK